MPTSMASTPSSASIAPSWQELSHLAFLLMADDLQVSRLNA